MMYGSWDIKCKGQSFLSFWAIFCLLTLLLTQKSKILKKRKPGDIIIVLLLTTNDNHILYGPFYPLPSPLTIRKIKILKKWKKHLEISSFYTSVPKIMIIGYTVPEIWHMMDVIIIFLGYFLPFYCSNHQKNENVKKIKKHLEISWFYTSAGKFMIICYTAPEIWCMIDLIVLFHFGLLFALLPPLLPPPTPLTAWKI